MNKLIVMCTIALFLCAFNSEKKNTMNTIESNKALILKAYQLLFGQIDSKNAELLIAENYKQHNPMVKDGRSGFLEFLEILKQMPKPSNPVKPFMRIIADTNFVAVHSKVPFMGQMRATVDLYRIENNQLAEHWDASEVIPAESKNGNPMVEGPVEISDPEKTSANILAVKKFTHEVLISKRMDKVGEYIAEDIIQHSPDKGNGLAEWINYQITIEVTELHCVIGEGNFVVTQTKAMLNEKPYALYFVYNLSNGKIVEEWSVKQEIPEQVVHSNGML